MSLAFAGEESCKEEPRLVSKIHWNKQKTALIVFAELPERSWVYSLTGLKEFSWCRTVKNGCKQLLLMYSSWIDGGRRCLWFLRRERRWTQATAVTGVISGGFYTLKLVLAVVAVTSGVVNLRSAENSLFEPLVLEVPQYRLVEKMWVMFASNWSFMD